MKTFLFSLIFMVIYNISFAQIAPETKKKMATELDEMLQKMNANEQFNGTLLLAENGEIFYEKSLGYANIAAKDELKNNSSFRLASVSKQFMGMGIMILKERNKLNYDDPITKFFPELPYKNITVRHLLHHTGGLPDYMLLFEQKWDTEEEDTDKRKPAFNKDLIEMYAAEKPEVLFEPGERFDYSNTGYVILGSIIEKASGQTIYDFFQENIFKPLGMKDSKIYSPDDSFKLDHRVYGFSYSANEKGYEENDWTFINGMVGDGAVYASARDLLKWDQALYGEKLVKKSTLDEAFTSGKLNDGSETGYGFGWGVANDEESGLQVSHSGGWVGFRTYIIRAVDEKLTIVLLTNHSSNQLGSILGNLKKLRDGEDYKMPKISISKEVAKAINNSGAAAGIKKYNELKNSKSTEYDFSEHLLNNLGYSYLNKKEYENAIAIFKLNVENYPKSSNVYDSLGEAYLEASKTNYKKALALNPGTETARKVLSDLGALEENTPQLTAEDLKEYPGEYPLSPAFVITVSQEDNQLFLQATGQPKLEVFPQSEDKFFLKVVDAQIKFNRNSEGKVESLTLFQNGMEQVGMKK